MKTMSYHQEDLSVDSEPDFAENNQKSNPGSPPIIHKTTIIQVGAHSNVNLVVGDHNLQKSNLSKSMENICENCSSTNSSPFSTINRSTSMEFLDSYTEDDPHKKVENLRRKFEEDFGVYDPIVIKKSSFHGSYSCQESDTSSCCESDLTTDSCEPDNSFTSPVDYPILPQKRKISVTKNTAKCDVDEEGYISMDGNSASVDDSQPSQSIDPPHKPDRPATSGKIPRHKLEEAQATLGFRSDVNGELKRVRRILRPHKFKDGYYVLWQFSDYVLSLSVTFLHDIKTFAVIYDPKDHCWLILKNGPRSQSLSVLLQIYLQYRVKLPLSRTPKRGGGNTTPGQTLNRNNAQIALNRNSSFTSGQGNKAPPLPPRRPSVPTLPFSGSPILPPRPNGFLTLQKPVIQPTDDGSVHN